MKSHFILIIACSFLLAGSAQAADFHGYSCTQDCSGHIAGYEWAEKKDITQRENCGGKSNSFIEGCYAWVEDRDGERHNMDERDEISDIENPGTVNE